MATTNTIYDAMTAGTVPIYGRTLTNPRTSSTFPPVWFGKDNQAADGTGVFEPLLLDLTNSPLNLRQPRLIVRTYPYSSPMLTDGVPFVIRASGLANIAATGQQLRFYLFQGNPTSGNVGSIGNSGTPASLPATIVSWSVKAECLWDSGSQIFNGLLSWTINDYQATSYFTLPNVAAPQVTIATSLIFAAGSTTGSGTVTLNEFFSDAI